MKERQQLKVFEHLFCRRSWYHSERLSSGDVLPRLSRRGVRSGGQSHKGQLLPASRSVCAGATGQPSPRTERLGNTVDGDLNSLKNLGTVPRGLSRRREVSSLSLHYRFFGGRFGAGRRRRGVSAPPR